jgi:pimeloyl-ACP methyl ester carboxylesterase
MPAATDTDTTVNAHRRRSELLGDLRELSLTQGTLQYFARGKGPVLVFCHGWLANANLWRNVVDVSPIGSPA